MGIKQNNHKPNARVSVLIHFGDMELNEMTDSLFLVLMLALEKLKYPPESELLTKLNFEMMQPLSRMNIDGMWPSSRNARGKAVYIIPVWRCPHMTEARSIK